MNANRSPFSSAIMMAVCFSALDDCDVTNASDEQSSPPKKQNYAGLIIGDQSTMAWSLCIHLKLTLPVKVLEVHEKYRFFHYLKR